MQVNQCLNPPGNLNNHQFQEDEAKISRPRYDMLTGQFLELYETLGYLTVRDDRAECFFDYGFLIINSKIQFSQKKNAKFQFWQVL